jgi:PAS domain S-box-containing protein
VLVNSASPTAARYAAAVVIMGLFLVIRLLLQPWLGLSVPYLQFFPAIMLTARIVGFGPGMLATGLSAAFAMFFFLAPTHTFVIANAADRFSIVLFLAVGASLVAIVESARRSEMAAREAAANADAHARELDAVFEAIPDAVYVGRGNRLTKVNPAGLRMLGATSLKDLGDDVSGLAERFAIRSAESGAPLAPDDLQFTRALRGEPAVDLVTARRLDTGEERILRSSAAPIRAGSDVVGAVVVNTDVTEAQQASLRLAQAAEAVSAVRQRLAEVVSNVPGVVYEAWGEPDAASQRIDFVSDYVQTMLGYDPAEWTSTPNFWLTIVHPDDRERAAREASAIFASGVPGRSEFRWMHRDGRVVWVEAHSNVIVDGEGRPIGMRGVTLDITARKQLEIERAELLNREQAARADAVAANRLKDDFLATLSHELRTPLNAILGYARMLRTGAIDPARQARALEIVERNATSLTQMVEDVLDVSRVMSGKIRLNLATVDLVRVVEDSIATVRPAADAKGVRIDPVLARDAGRIAGDADRLQQVVWNLLSNAVRFTPRDGTVQVRLERQGDVADIVVRDTGAGIEPRFLAHVFERFRQADSRPSREYGGLGLGLAIARDLVELHGGSIRAESDGPGQGATFTVTLPISLRPAAGTESHEARTAQPARDLVLAGLRVLVVDDEPDALTLMREVLEGAGATVSEAPSAAGALSMVNADCADVIVSDLGMPGMDGYAFIAQLRSSESETLRNVPVAALTAYARSEDGTRVLRSGFQMHLSKPIDPGELVAGVAALAGRKDA